jgi:[ribosomal protein S5]-alanine N-acetyltransferase
MSEGDTAPESLDTEAPLLTPRLALAPLRAEHAALLFESLQDPRLYTYIPDDPPDSLQALEARYQRWERRASPDGHEVWLNWAAQSRATGEWVGTFQATIMEDREALLAYMIFTPFQRQGFAREGCLRVIEHLVEGYGVEVAAEIDTRNAASIALVESLGFRLVATTYEADTFKGAVSDEHRYERATALHTPSSRA